jgi:hypothetical protein
MIPVKKDNPFWTLKQRILCTGVDAWGIVTMAAETRQKEFPDTRIAT